MTRKLIKFTSILISILIFLIFYLSFFGINTDKFNDKIKSEITKINKKISLELKDVTILLNPFNFTINFKTYGPNIIVGKQKVKLHFIKTNVSLKSIINKNFSIDDVQISTKEVKLDNIILLMRSFDNSTELFILGSMVKKGTLIGDINLKFNDEGKIKKDYEIKGFIRNSKIKVPALNEVDNLNFNFKIKDKE